MGRSYSLLSSLSLVAVVYNFTRVELALFRTGIPQHEVRLITEQNPELLEQSRMLCNQTQSFSGISRRSPLHPNERAGAFTSPHARRNRRSFALNSVRLPLGSCDWLLMLPQQTEVGSLRRLNFRFSGMHVFAVLSLVFSTCEWPTHRLTCL